MTTLLIQGDARRIPLADGSVDLVFGSPPYVDARLYLEGGRNLGISRGCAEWVGWMLGVTAECLRVSRGPVVWVASGVTRERNYWPACEGLMWEWYRRGGHAYRPCYWHRSGIQGSGGDQWFRADVEYVMCFKRPGKLAWSDNTAMGHPPKYKPGGVMTNRTKNGKRVFDRSWKLGQVKHPSGQNYTDPDLANPGNLVRTANGGGNIGHELCHLNEAPFPEALAEHFLRSLCPPGGTVLDPFSGSGTTAAVAARLERRGVGLDLRRSQCDLGARRTAEALRPVSKLDPAGTPKPLPGQLSFLEQGAVP